MIRHAITLAMLPCAAVLLAATIGCNSSAGASADVEKAQIAVRANPALELMATDEKQGVLTVRVRKSAKVLTVSVADVISGIAFRDIDSDAPAAANANARTSGSGGGGSQRVAVSTPDGGVAVDRSRNGVAVSTPEGQVAVRQSGNGVAVSTPDQQVAVRQSGSGVGVSTAERDAAPRRNGGVNVSTPEGQVAVRQSGNGVKVSTPDTQVGVKQTRDGSLAVSTPDTKVKIGADGISVADGSGARDANTARRAPAGGSSAQDPSGQGANIDDSRLDRQSRQISCTADGTVDIVNVLLRVDDVAVKTVGGCRIHIRNSHIIGDIGVQAQGGSTVTIDNSIIEGRTALSLQGSVNMSVQSSTIRGPVRRVGSVTLRDLGNNLWR